MSALYSAQDNTGLTVSQTGNIVQMPFELVPSAQGKEGVLLFKKLNYIQYHLK